MSNTYTSTTNPPLTATGPPIVVADDQGTADVNENPELHIDPFEAAKQIRPLSREIRKKAQQLSGNVGYDQGLKLNDARTHLRVATERCEKAEEFRRQLAGKLDVLREAVVARRAAPGLAAIKEISFILAWQQDSLRRIETRHSRVGVIIDSLATPGSPPDTSGIIEMCNRLHVLAQSLPTFPNAPITPADNILRAMASVLKNGGYLDSSSEYVKVTTQNKPFANDAEPDDQEDEEHGDDD